MVKTAVIRKPARCLHTKSYKQTDTNMTSEEIKQIDIVKLSLQRHLNDIKKLAGINSLILAVCLVDTLAGFFNGYDGKDKHSPDGKTKIGNKKRYENFVDVYLESYKTDLYKLRCNLTHSFSNTVSNYMFIDNPEFTKVFGNNISIFGAPLFSIDTFKTDLESAFTQYFSDLANNSQPEIQSNFKIRFNSFGILQDSVIGTVRNLKDELINHIDQADTLPGTNLKIMSFDPTGIKK